MTSVLRQLTSSVFDSVDMTSEQVSNSRAILLAHEAALVLRRIVDKMWRDCVELAVFPPSIKTSPIVTSDTLYVHLYDHFDQAGLQRWDFLREKVEEWPLTLWHARRGCLYSRYYFLKMWYVSLGMYGYGFKNLAVTISNLATSAEFTDRVIVPPPEQTIPFIEASFKAKSDTHFLLYVLHAFWRLQLWAKAK